MKNQTSVFGPRTSGKRRFAQLALVAVLALVFLGAGDTATRFSALGHGMICACGCNQILLECNHVGCSYSDRMRGELQQMLDKGMSDEAITQEFVLKYGNTILAAPTTSGFNLVAWVVPFLVLGTATFFAALLVRRWKSGAEPLPATAAAGAPLDEYRERARRETEL
ncbi:MAG TPA: cytochrome c-type biogenesis protein CcmH [Terriglobales bacterium]|jgi:cytochrome c-type biogenesis protein CcmH|nr:cytochrome c-type biogenesis protein CcmH [Terriglobales bacterium]